MEEVAIGSKDKGNKVRALVGKGKAPDRNKVQGRSARNGHRGLARHVRTSRHVVNGHKVIAHRVRGAATGTAGVAIVVGRVRMVRRPAEVVMEEVLLPRLRRETRSCIDKRNSLGIHRPGWSPAVQHGPG